MYTAKSACAYSRLYTQNKQTKKKRRKFFPSSLARSLYIAKRTSGGDLGIKSSCIARAQTHTKLAVRELLFYSYFFFFSFLKQKKKIIKKLTMSSVCCLKYQTRLRKIQLDKTVAKYVLKVAQRGAQKNRIKDYTRFSFEIYLYVNKVCDATIYI